nr:abnormal spindle-like microcephaly-associated protein homolog isoform X2 [Procambarus clarkii]
MSHGGFLVVNPSPEKDPTTRKSQSRSTSYFEISPVHKQQAKPVDEEIPVLRLVHFTHSPKITFDTVKLGTTCHRKLKILNPKDQAQQVNCEKFPKPESGITCSAVQLDLEPSTSVELVLSWTPVQEGNFRDLICWKSNLGVRSQTVLLGTCVEPKKKAKARIRAPLKPKNVAPVCPASRKSIPAKAPRIVRGPSKNARRKPDAENKPPAQTTRPPAQTTRPPAQDPVVKQDATLSALSSNMREVPSKSLRRVLLSTSSQESVDIPSIMNSTEISETLLANTDCGAPSNLSISTIEFDFPSSLRKNPSKEKAHVMWKNPSDDKDLHTRRMTYCLLGEDAVINVTDQEVSKTNIVQEEVLELVYDEVRESHTYEVVRESDHNQTKTLVSSKEIIKTNSTHSEEVWRVTDVFPGSSEKSIPHRRKTFARRGMSRLQEDLDEGAISPESKSSVSVPSKEVFKNITEGQLPDCEAAASPLRRDTFVASKEGNFRPLERDDLPDCNEIATPIRRQTYITSSVETFSSVSASQLPACNVSDSPMRRQTFVKEQTDIKHLGPVQKVGLQSDKWMENSGSSNTSTPTVGVSPPLGPVSLGMLLVTPITPGPQMRPNNYASIKASCMNLLEKLKTSEEFPESPKPHMQSCKSTTVNKAEDTLDYSQSGMCTAPESPFSEYETAPSTPSEPALAMEDFNVTLEFPTPKIGDTVSRMKNVNLTDVSNILELELANQRKALGDSMSTDSLEKTFSNKDEMNNQWDELNPTICKRLDLETDSETFHVNNHDILITREADSDAHDNALPNRLSSGTVTKETSILHPDDLVIVDDQHTSYETIVKDLPTFSPSFLPQVTDTHHPRRMSTIGITDLSNSKQHSDHRRRSEPLGLHLPPYESAALNELLLFKGANKRELENTKVEGQRGDENFVVASLADFDFSPGVDHRRCSTSIKSLPPEELVDHRRLSDKGRKLFVEPEHEAQEFGKPVCLDSNASDPCISQCLSTIMEVEEGTFALNKTQDLPSNKTQDFPKNKSYDIPLNMTHSLHLDKSREFPLANINELPLNETRTVPMSSGAEVPMSSGAEVPMSSGAEVPMSSGVEVPMSSGVEVPTSSGVEVPTSSGAEIPTSSGAEIPTSSGAEVPTSSCTEVPLSSCTEVPMSSGTEVPSNQEVDSLNKNNVCALDNICLRETKEISLNVSNDFPINETEDPAVNKVQEFSSNITKDFSQLLNPDLLENENHIFIPASQDSGEVKTTINYTFTKFTEEQRYTSTCEEIITITDDPVVVEGIDKCADNAESQLHSVNDNECSSVSTDNKIRPLSTSSEDQSTSKENDQGNEGLLFIKISPSHSKRLPEKHSKESCSKRSRITPTPVFLVTEPSLKSSKEKRIGVKKPAVVSSKCKSPRNIKSLKTTGGLKPSYRCPVEPKMECKLKPGVQSSKTLGQRRSTSSGNLRRTTSNSNISSTIESTNLISSASVADLRHHSDSSNSSLSISALSSICPPLSASAADITVFSHVSGSSSTLSLGNVSSASNKAGNKRPALKKSMGLRVPHSRLTLLKFKKSTVVHHPNPYASKNMYYDDRWIEKQMNGFTKWLNFILTPPEEEDVESKVKKVDMGQLWSEATKSKRVEVAPTKEVMSLRSYSARRRLNRLRRKACRLYQSDEMVEVVMNLETAIDKKYLMIRKDRLTHADIGLKQLMLQLVLCYNPLWLRIGLETVYGELLHLTSNSDITGITQFLITRLLTNPDIAAEYAHPTVPHSYRAGYDDSIKKFQLKKFLLLVFFLDRAKTLRLINHDPCLFNKNADHKTSKDILIAFAREFLSGIGDITKHLGYLGYNVSHKQTVLEEFGYAVTNLAVDLRCGVRLTRVVEMLTQKFDLSSKLRVPAISRLQKIHNTDVAMAALEGAGCVGVKTKFPSKDIVDGHREQTLALLWTIIFKFQVSVMISETRLREEIYYLHRSLVVRSQLEAPACAGLELVSEAVTELSLLSKKESGTTETLLSYLKLWAQFTCAHYGLDVDNLTVSFSDGRALCLLLHHYHPDLMPMSLINWKTTQTLPAQGINLDSSLDDSFSEMTYADMSTKDEYNQRLANERENFAVFIDKVSQLDGIPLVIRSNDMINTIPDEKVTSTFVAYLCARLLDLSEEMKAARIIQMAWRKHLAAKRLEQLKVHTHSAIVIQRWWRTIQHKRQREKYEKAAIVLQAHWRRWCACRLLHILKHKKELERQVRGWLTKRTFTIERKACIQIQSWYRSMYIRKSYLAQKDASIKIQRFFRAYQLKKHAQNHFAMVKRIVIGLQAITRGHLVRKQLKRKHAATTIIQARYRGWKARQAFIRKRNAAIVIQQHLRSYYLGNITRRNFRETQNKIILVQAVVRGYLARKEMKVMQSSALVIQRTWKMHWQRKIYRTQRKSAILIQKAYRSARLGREARNNYRTTINAVVCIQAHFRGFSVRRRYLKQRNGALTIQKYYRAYNICKTTRNDYLYKYRCITKSQAIVRGFLARQNLKKRVKSATLLQSCIRTYLAKKVFLQQKSAAMTIQRHYRLYRLTEATRHEYLAKRSSVIHLQAAVRGFLTRRALRQKHDAAIMIQAAVKSWIAQRKYLKVVKCVKTLQIHWRATLLMWKEREKYHIFRGAGITIQAAWRGAVVRRQMRESQCAALVIQSWIRCCLERRRYQRIKESTKIIQQWWRRITLAEGIRKDFVRKREAAIVLQASVRKFLVIQKIKKLHVAATCIQAYYKAHYHRQQFLRQRHNYVKVQRWWRSVKKMQEQRCKCNQSRSAVITLQAGVRGMLVRRQMSRQNSAAVKIQSFVKMWLVQRKYKQIVQNIKSVQKWWKSIYKMRHQQADYQKKRAAVIKLQAYARGMLARKEIKRWHFAASKIQSNVRCYLACKKYRDIINNTIKIQCWWRSTQARIRDVNQQHMAATVIQSHARHFLISRKYKKMVVSAIKIQRWVRSVHKTREHHTQYLAMRAATITLQASVRGMLVRREIAHQRCAQVKIAAVFRGWLLRRTYQKVVHKTVTIQRWWRSVKLTREGMKNFAVTKNAIITIQAFTRGALLRATISRQKNAAVKIQSHVRGWMARREYHKVTCSVLLLQRWWRGHKETKKLQLEYHTKRNAVITLQRHYRGRIARKEYLKQRRAIIKMQACTRCWLAQRNYVQILKATLNIQHWWKAVIKGREQRKKYQTLRISCITLQASLRGMLTRKKILQQHRAAVRLQTCIRQWLARKHFLRKVQSIIIIQKWWRSVKMAKTLQCRFIAIKKATLVLQSHTRGMLVRQSIRKQHLAATKIQSYIRCWSAQRKYHKKMEAVVKLQRYWRGACLTLRTREQFIYMQRAAVIVQAAWRKHKTRTLLKQIKAAQIIQAYVRGWQVRRTIRQEKRKLYLEHVTRVTKAHLAATVIQRSFRRWQTMVRVQQTMGSLIKLQRWVRAVLQRSLYLRQRSSAIIIQRAWRSKLECLKEDRRQRAATVLQAAWRGLTARKNLQNKKLVEVRKRLKVATQDATDSKRIGNRTDCAIAYLIKYKDLRRILIAVMYLDTSTRWSPTCSEKLTEGTTLGTIMFLLRSCNRSIPHMQILGFVLNILINLAKYPYTAPFIHKVEGLMETIVQLLTIYSEKGPGIFCKCCTLLYIVTATNPTQQDMINPKLLKDLKSIRTLMIRRENASLRGKNPVKVTPLPVSKIPSITPDWVLTPNQPREFDDPISAIVTLLARIGMQAK